MTLLFKQAGFATLLMVLWQVILFSTGRANANAESYTVSIVYPDVRAPYSKVFEDIAAGIDKTYQGRTQRIGFSSGDSPDKIKKKLLGKGSDAIVCLGSSSLKIVKSLDLGIPVLSGAVIKNGGPVSGISMIPDGALVADILLDIAPEVRRIFALTSSKISASLVDSAGQRLKIKERVLLTYPVSSYKEAAIAYRNILGKVTEGDAIWLLPGSRYLDSTLFSLILEAAWKKDIVVFSSNPSHVRRGALFAVYPNNLKMGEALGQMANDMTRSGWELEGLLPLENLFVGVNKRTAKHLDINLDDEMTGKAEVIVFTQ